jgi:hypothetical protein
MPPAITRAIRATIHNVSGKTGLSEEEKEGKVPPATDFSGLFPDRGAARARAAKRPREIIKKIGFAPASCLFPGTSIFGFGFKLAFRVRTGD